MKQNAHISRKPEWLSKTTQIKQKGQFMNKVWSKENGQLHKGLGSGDLKVQQASFKATLLWANKFENQVHLLIQIPKQPENIGK